MTPTVCGITREELEKRIAILEGDHVMLENPFTRAEMLTVYRMALSALPITEREEIHA